MQKSATLNFSYLNLSELIDLREHIDALIAERAATEAATDDDMAHVIKITKFDTYFTVDCYYNDDFVGNAKDHKGRWKNDKWQFPLDKLEEIKRVIYTCFGVTGEHPYAVCTLLVKDYSITKFNKQGIELFGRPIAKCFNPNLSAKISPDIELIDGEFEGGGSWGNIKTIANAVTFKILNFPLDFANDNNDVQRAIDEGWVEVI